jgi:hypothetical protein
VSRTEQPRYTLTEEHRAQLDGWAQRWIANALRTEPQSKEDRTAMSRAMRGMYHAAEFEPPPREVFCPSPVSGAIAATIASAVWWLREHPMRHAELFGRHLSHAEIDAAAKAACARTTATALGREPAADLAVEAATFDLAVDATFAATHGAVEAAATFAATHGAVEAATFDLAVDATFAATHDATSGAVDIATRDEVDAAAASRVASDEAVAAVRAEDEIFVATRNAIDEAVDVVTRDTIEAAAHTVTRASVDEVDDVISARVCWRATRTANALLRFFVNALSRWHLLRNGGNQWSGWVSYLSFFRHVVQLDLPQSFAHYEAAAVHGGPRFMHARFWIVSDFPTVLGRDDRHRSHSLTGPSLAWRDGWRVYRIHGVAVPAQVVEAPETITVAQIEAEQNTEVRRVLVEQYGTARYLADSGAVEIHRDDWGILMRKEQPDDDPIIVVDVLNSTPEIDGSIKRYTLSVHPELRPLLGFSAAGEPEFGEPQEMTARNAVASTFGLRGEDYAPLVQT